MQIANGHLIPSVICFSVQKLDFRLLPTQATWSSFPGKIFDRIDWCRTESFRAGTMAIGLNDLPGCADMANVRRMCVLMLNGKYIFESNTQLNVIMMPNYKGIMRYDWVEVTALKNVENDSLFR